ncbi:MAG: hypothetical protein JOY64_17590 [Alphaproteobacteria bacterium]|nr:hypothetical protein [Alphaproteobacteria bacterium]MBV8409446.1 hypothetical protein [Alphaproteobacteria bacterium]
MAGPVPLLNGAIMAVGIASQPWTYFQWLAGILLAYCVRTQALKFVFRRRFGMWL